MKFSELNHVYLLNFNPEEKYVPDFTVSVKKNQPALVISRVDGQLRFATYKDDMYIPLGLTPSNEDITYFNTQIAAIKNTRKSGRVDKPQDIETVKSLFQQLTENNEVEHQLPGESSKLEGELLEIFEIRDAERRKTELIKFVKNLTAIASKDQVSISTLLNQWNNTHIMDLFTAIYPVFRELHKEKQKHLQRYIAAYHHAEKLRTTGNSSTTEDQQALIERAVNFHSTVKNQVETLQALEFFVKSLSFEKGKANKDILKYLQEYSSHSSSAIQQTSSEHNANTLAATIYQPLDNEEEILRAHTQLSATLQTPDSIIGLEDNGISLKESIDALKMRQLYLQRINQHHAKTIEVETASEVEQLSADGFILAVLESAEKKCENNENARNIFSSYYYNALLEYACTDTLTAATKAAKNTALETFIGDEAAQYDNTVIRTLQSGFPFNVIKNTDKLPPNAWFNVIIACSLEDLQTLGKSIQIPFRHIINNKLDTLLTALTNNALDEKAKFIFLETIKALKKNKPNLSAETCEKLINASLSHCGDMDNVLKLLSAYSDNKYLFNAILKSPVYAAYLINNPEILWKYLGETTIDEADLTSNANHSEPYTLEGVKINHCLLAKYFSQLNAKDFENLSNEVQGRFKHFNAAQVPPTILKQLSPVLKEQIILSFKYPATFTRSFVFEDSILFDAVTTGFESKKMQEFFEVFLDDQCLEGAGSIAPYHQHNIVTAFFRYFKERGEETNFWECLQKKIPQHQMKNCIDQYIFQNRTCMEAMANVGQDSFYKLATHDTSKTANSIFSWMGYDIKPDRYEILTPDILTPLVESYLVNSSEATEKVLSDWLLLQFKYAFDEANKDTKILTTTSEATAAEIELVLLKNDKAMAVLRNQAHIPVWSQLLGNPAFRQALKIKYSGSKSNLERILNKLYKSKNPLQDIAKSLTAPFYNKEGKFVLDAANEVADLSAFGMLDQFTIETQLHFGLVALDKISGSINTINYALVHTIHEMKSAHNAHNENIKAWKDLLSDYLGSLHRIPAANEKSVNLVKELPEIRKTIAYALGGSHSKNPTTEKMAGHALDVLLTPQQLLYFKKLHDEGNPEIQIEIKQIIQMMFMADAPKFLKTLATPYRELEWNWIVNDVLEIQDLLAQESNDEAMWRKLLGQWSLFAACSGVIENATKAITDEAKTWWSFGGEGKINLETCRQIAHARTFEKEQQFNRTGSFKNGWAASIKRAEKYSGGENPKIRSQWLYATTEALRAKLGLNTTELKSKHIEKSWREETPIKYELQDINKESTVEKKQQFVKSEKRQVAFANLVERRNKDVLEKEKEKQKDQYVDARPAVKEEHKKTRTRQYLNEFLQDSKNLDNIQKLKNHLSLKVENESVNANLTDMEAILKVVQLGSIKVAGTIYSHSSNTTLAGWYYSTIGYLRNEKAVKEDDHLTPLKAMLVEMAIEENDSKDPLIDCMLSIMRGEEKPIALSDAFSENDIASLEKIITDSSATIERYLSKLMKNETLSATDLKNLSDALVFATSKAIQIRCFSDSSTAVAKTSEWFSVLREMKDNVTVKRLLTETEFKCANVADRLISSRSRDSRLEKESLAEKVQVENQETTPDVPAPQEENSVSKVLESEITDLKIREIDIKARIEAVYPTKNSCLQEMRYSPGRLFAGGTPNKTAGLEDPAALVAVSAA